MWHCPYCDFTGSPFEVDEHRIRHYTGGDEGGRAVRGRVREASMRAFMSTGAKRDWQADSAQYVAKCEARRILAETEPASEPEHWFGEKYRATGLDVRADVTAHRTFAQMRAGNTAPALADALRAFVGEGGQS